MREGGMGQPEQQLVTAVGKVINLLRSCNYKVKQDGQLNFVAGIKNE
jgi:hypothetical protein